MATILPVEVAATYAAYPPAPRKRAARETLAISVQTVLTDYANKRERA